MKHFEYYPTIEYSEHLSTNIMVRGRIRDAVLANKVLYYKYTVPDGMKPEMISHKYYGTPNHVWSIYYANNIHDPIIEWPMDSRIFDQYIIDKYGSINKANQKFLDNGQLNLDSIHHYVLNNSYSKQSYIVDYETYLDFQVRKNTKGTNPYLDGDVVEPVTFYEYENGLNEKRREIVVIDNTHLSQMINEFIVLFD